MTIEYRKEFFDRQYTARESYGRIWQYAKRYKFRLFVGVLCGILTAGTLLPLFQVVQPALAKVSQNEVEHALAETPKTQSPGENAGGAAASGASSSLEREMESKARLPSWYPKAEKLARRCGITLQDESGAMGGALLLIAIFIIPLIAAFRLVLIFLNHYCLAWAAARMVMDLRVDMLRNIQRQSMQFFGRIDVGQLMSRTTSDPFMVQGIVQNILAQLARAPFEVLIAAGFIVWFAVSNEMIPTLVVILIGVPAFIIPIRGIGKRIRRWSRKMMEKNSIVGSRMHEILTCIRVVKAYNTEEIENRSYETVNRRLLGMAMRALRWGLFVGPAVETVGILLLCGFLAWCFSTRVTIANILPMLAPLLLIYKPIKQLSSLQVSIEEGVEIEEKLFGSCFETHDQVEGMACFLSKDKPKPKAVFTNN